MMEGTGMEKQKYAAIVLAAGSGKQLIINTINGKCERHYEKSRKSIKQSIRTQ